METNYHPEKCIFKECAFPNANCNKCVANEKNRNNRYVPKIDAHSNYKFVRTLSITL